MAGGHSPRRRRDPGRGRDRHHDRAAGQAHRAPGRHRRAGRRGGPRADRRARRRRPHQRLGRADPPQRPRPPEGGGRQMSAHGYWTLALIIGLGAALIVATLLALLIRSVASIEQSVDGLLQVAGKVAGNTANIPQLEATAPVLALIVDEAVVQDGYMNALTDGFGATETTSEARCATN